MFFLTFFILLFVWNIFKSQICLASRSNQFVRSAQLVSNSFCLVDGTHKKIDSVKLRFRTNTNVMSSCYQGLDNLFAAVNSRVTLW